jgi:TPP-dependent pyruvate/acetoin dehydrogenase alpha subunit
MSTDREVSLDLYRKTTRHFLLREQASRVCAQCGSGRLCDSCTAPAVGIAAIAALRPGDCVVTSHGDHASNAACDSDPARAIAELTCGVEGCPRGLGSARLSFADHVCVGPASTDAAVSFATGAAFVEKYRGEGRVLLCFTGAGPTAVTSLLGTMKLAFQWGLPIVFVRVSDSPATNGGKPGVAHDALDPTASIDVATVHARVKAAVERARSGSGPTLVDVVCDTTNERCRKESAACTDGCRCREHGAVSTLRARLLDLGVAQAEIAAVDEEMMQQVAGTPSEPPRWYWW